MFEKKISDEERKKMEREAKKNAKASKKKESTSQTRMKSMNGKKCGVVDNEYDQGILWRLASCHR